MRQILSRAVVALSIVCVMFAASQARASSISVLVDPAGSKEDNIWPMNSGSMTWQMVYGSSFFGASPLQIQSFGFKGFDGGSVTYGDFVVKMSTTSTAPGAMSTTFANNVGADEATVMSGPLAFSATTGVFTDLILDTVFNYDPLLGNLLIQIEHAAATAGGNVGLESYDPTPGGLERVARASFPTATGTSFGFGELVTRFDAKDRQGPPPIVPLPAALPLIGSGLAILGFAGWRRKRQAA